MSKNLSMLDYQQAFLNQLRDDGAALIAAARAAPSAAVSACPGWDNMTLAAHVGGLWHWVSRQVRQARPADRPERPATDADQWGWIESGLSALLGALQETDPEATAWNWTRSERQTAAFWVRRMTQETAMHRWDAQAAAGAPDPIVSWLAADGIEEIMSMWLPARRGRAKESVTGTAHLHVSDAADGQPSEWFLQFGPCAARKRDRAAQSAVRTFGTPQVRVESRLADGEVECLGIYDRSPPRTPGRRLRHLADDRPR